MSAAPDIADLWRRAARLGPRGIWSRLRAKASRRAELYLGERAARRNLRPGQLDRDFARALTAGCRMADVPAAMRRTVQERFLFSPAEREARLAALRRMSSESPVRIVAQAERLLAHEFDLLGSGPCPLGPRIDWHVDFKSGHRWNPATYHRRVAAAPWPGGYDIKVPWELARFQHLSRLGQAWWLTGEARFAAEVVAQVRDWIAANPAGFGVNWACAMEVALRVIGWWFALGFVADSPAVDDEFLALLARSLWQHGEHIVANLEGSAQRSTNSNHYLSDLVGLAYLGLLMPWLKAAAAWRELALAELWRELAVQVGDDGLDYEGSLAYHRLASELYLAVVLLCRRNEVAVPATVSDRVGRMLEAGAALVRPDGATPQVGDGDNGRVWRLAAWSDAAREWDDYRPLLAVGGAALDRADLLALAGDSAEEAVWLAPVAKIGNLGSTDGSAAANQATSVSRTLATAGVYLLRWADAYLLVCGGASGTGGVGNHSHGDLASFEFALGRQRMIVDPGTGCYTSDYALRNRLRSVVSHNTVVVDNREHGQLQPQLLFTLRHKPAARAIECNLTGPRQRLVLEYGLPDCDWTHRRTFDLNGHERRLSIVDELLGAGRHRVATRFNFWPAVELQRHGETALVLGSGDALGWRLEFVPGKRDCRLETYPFSPSYGVCEDRLALVATGEFDFPARWEYTICWHGAEVQRT